MGHIPDEPERVKPPCFGDAERVCPRNEDGFIEPQRECLQCPEVRACLQAALQAQGVLKTPTAPSPMAESCIGRFLKRWSERKRSVSRAEEQTEPS